MLTWQDITLWHVILLLKTIHDEKFNNYDVWPVGVCVWRWRSFNKQT